MAKENTKEQTNELALLAKQYSAFISSPTLKKIGLPVFIATVAIILADVFYLQKLEEPLIPEFVTTAVIAVLALISTAAFHAITLDKPFGVGSLNMRQIRYVLIGSALALVTLFITSSYIPTAVGGALATFILINAAAHWSVADTNKREAEELEEEIEEIQQGSELEGEDPEFWDDFMRE